MHNINKKNQSGFTLVETLIYTALIGTVITSFIYSSISVTNARNKNYVGQEVHANARSALRLISEKVKSASSIVSPLPGNSGNSMVLDMPVGDDLTIDVNNGVLRIAEGIASPIAITSDEVEVSSISFVNTTPDNGKDNIKITSTIKYRMDSSMDFFYSMDFQTAVSIR